MSDKTLTKTVVLSKKNTVVLRELTALESLDVDDRAGDGSSNRAYKTYAVCSIESMNGNPQFPITNDKDFQYILERLSIGELGKLVKAYVEFAVELAEHHDPKSSPETKESGES